MSVTQLQTVSNNYRPAPFVIAPTNMMEAMEYSKLIASSCFCPKDMKGKPGDVLVAVQMGAEIGLSPIQALQNIAVINGRPCVWGDAALAVVIGSSHYVSHREWFEGSVEKGNLTAHCGVTRKGSEEYVRSFSMDDAKKANLWSKPGVWQQYPSRMLQMRARAFAIRDKFADALKGIHVREEVEDYNLDRPTRARSEQKVIEVVESRPAIEHKLSPEESLKVAFEKFTADLEACTNTIELKKVFDGLKMINWSGTDYLQKLVALKDARKNVIMAPQAVESKAAVNEDNSDFLEAYDKTADLETGEVQHETV